MTSLRSRLATLTCVAAAGLTGLTGPGAIPAIAGPAGPAGPVETAVQPDGLTRLLADGTPPAVLSRRSTPCRRPPTSAR